MPGPDSQPHRHHRPLARWSGWFDEVQGGVDPAVVSEAADRAAAVLVRGVRAGDDQEVSDRLVHLAETEGLETIAEVWAGAPADSLAGCLWRLFVLRSWVHADPLQVSREFSAGRDRAEVAELLAGVADPPGPAELQTMVDEVLRGILEREFADVLLRASAFARVVATGRAVMTEPTTADVRRMLTLAEQLEAAGHLELAGRLS